MAPTSRETKTETNLSHGDWEVNQYCIIPVVIVPCFRYGEHHSSEAMNDTQCRWRSGRFFFRRPEKKRTRTAGYLSAPEGNANAKIQEQEKKTRRQNEHSAGKKVGRVFEL